MMFRHFNTVWIRPIIIICETTFTSPFYAKLNLNTLVMSIKSKRLRILVNFNILLLLWNHLNNSNHFKLHVSLSKYIYSLKSTINDLHYLLKIWYITRYKIQHFFAYHRFTRMRSFSHFAQEAWFCKVSRLSI